MFADVTSDGRLFQVLAAATDNTRSPIVDRRVSGTVDDNNNSHHRMHAQPKNPRCRYGGPTVRHISADQRLHNFRLQQKQFPRVTTVPYTPWWRCYIECYSQCYDTVIRRMWVMAAGRNFVFKIAVKPLQIGIRVLLADYRNSSRTCPTVPSPTVYDVPFRYNTCVRDDDDDNRQTSVDKQTDDALYPRLDLTVAPPKKKFFLLWRKQAGKNVFYLRGEPMGVAMPYPLESRLSPTFIVLHGLRWL